MGFNGRVAAKAIDKDLKTKIDAVTAKLDHLHAEARQVLDSSRRAKNDISEAVDEIVAALMNRKEQLILMVENATMDQLTELQSSIQKSSVALGSMQSIAANIHKFDDNQLSCLHIPAVEPVNPEAPSRKIDVDVRSNLVLDKISNWGAMKSESEDFLEQPFEFDGEFVEMLQCQILDDDNPVCRTRRSSVANLSSRDALTSDDSCGIFDKQENPERLYDTMSHWMSRLQVIDSKSHAHVSDLQKKTNNLLPCITKPVEGIDSVGSWLKPRKRPFGASNENISLKKGTPNVAPGFQSYVLSDASEWVHKGVKKSRNQFSSDTSSVKSYKEISPNAQTLPYPFWLLDERVKKN